MIIDKRIFCPELGCNEEGKLINFDNNFYYYECPNCGLMWQVENNSKDIIDDD